MSKMTIIEGNSNDKDQIRVYMVKGERGYSAYDLYVQQGGTLTEEEWLDAFLNANNFYNKSEVDNLLSAKADTEDLSTVATSGSYTDLDDKPTIPSSSNAYSTSTTNPYSASFINGTVLYEDSTGTDTGTITFSESKDNFNFIDFYSINGAFLGRIHIISGNQSVYLSYVHNTNGTNYYLYSLVGYLEDDDFIIGQNSRKLITTSIINQTDKITIGYIVGYKY